MRQPVAKIALRWLIAALAVLAVTAAIMRAVGVNVRVGSPPEFGWTAYPMMVVHRADQGGSLAAGKLPPRRVRPFRAGSLVTWADGTRTLYIHR